MVPLPALVLHTCSKTGSWTRLHTTAAPIVGALMALHVREGER